MKRIILTFKVKSMILIFFSLTKLIMGVDKVCKEQIKLPDRDINMVGVDTETRMETIRRLLQPLSVSALQRDCLEQDHLHQVQSPHLIRLSETIYSPHLPLLIRV